MRSTHSDNPDSFASDKNLFIHKAFKNSTKLRFNNKVNLTISSEFKDNPDNLEDNVFLNLKSKNSISIVSESFEEN